MAAGGLVPLGDLTVVATLTDAAVLTSFVLVNASLVWLAVTCRGGSRGVRRGFDLALAGVAALLCAWLAGHTGWIGLATVVVILAVGGVVASDGRRAMRRLVRKLALGPR
jgi:hypothetical protein